MQGVVDKSMRKGAFCFFTISAFLVSAYILHFPLPLLKLSSASLTVITLSFKSRSTSTTTSKSNLAIKARKSFT